MVRFTVLICVFGIASLCVAAFIHAPTAYARSARATCPCWPGGPSQLETVLGSPDDSNISLDTCDARPIKELGPCGNVNCFVHYAALGDSTFIGAEADIFLPGDGRNEASCQLFNDTIGYDSTQNPIPVSEAEACMHDINAYCRDYCKNNPNANCP